MLDYREILICPFDKRPHVRYNRGMNKKPAHIDYVGLKQSAKLKREAEITKLDATIQRASDKRDGFAEQVRRDEKALEELTVLLDKEQALEDRIAELTKKVVALTGAESENAMLQSILIEQEIEQVRTKMRAVYYDRS